MAKDFTQLLDKVRQGLMVRTDSRQVQPGEVFVAMPGVSVAGSRFIPDALDRGAAYVVDVSPGEWLNGSRARFIYHPNPARALGELAAAYFKTNDLSLKLVGVTGTNGKTTVSFLLEHLLAATGLKVGLLGTVVYRWPGFSLDAKLTTPDCWQTHDLLSNMAASDVDVVVMEVSSHALEQDRVAGLEFDTAILTNVTQDHLDYHGDMEAYFAAKSRLFHALPAEDKVGVINYDDPWGRRLLAGHSPSLGYGLSDMSGEPFESVQGEIVESSGKGMLLRTSYKNKTWDIETPLIGRHNASNLLAAQGAALSLGLGCNQMRRLSGFAGVPGRLERVFNDRGLDIFVDYAHTPDALVNVLTSLNRVGFERIVTVFGCGGDRDRAKRPLMGKAAAELSDVVVLTSDNPRHEAPRAIMDEILPGIRASERSPELYQEVSRAEAIRLAVGLMRPGDCLLVAGKGHETYQQIGDEFNDFSDVDHVREALEALA